MNSWISQAVFYHIYPLGALGAPAVNDFSMPPTPRLDQLHGWLDHIQWLGANTIYLGPVFESSAHGYDTKDYYWVDRRLGGNETLAAFSQALHARGMRLVLDGVFNHVGRDFWAFRDVIEKGPDSAYRDWFHNLRFDARSPYGDPFTYEGWANHYDLVKLNLRNPDARNHLLGAVESWARDFDIDGLRLDAADCLDFDFLRELGRFSRALKPDFWLMGEVVHGDYRRWANPEMLDTTTNYECYKGLYSSLNDKNYFEIAYALKRQSGAHGLYRDLALYNFVDNHDVNRVASNLTDPAYLYPLYALLFSMPGLPSIYYGSEWGLSGARDAHSDAALRPALNPAQMNGAAPHPDLAAWIHRLARARADSPALRGGTYHELHVAAQQLAFWRETSEERVVAAFNSAAAPARVNLTLPTAATGELEDLLTPGEHFEVNGGRATLTLPAYGARWLRLRG